MRTNFRIQNGLFEGMTLEVLNVATNEFDAVATIDKHGSEFKAKFHTAELYELDSNGLTLDEFANSASLYYLRFQTQFVRKLHKSKPTPSLNLFS